MTLEQQIGRPPTTPLCSSTAATGPTLLLSAPGAGKRYVIVFMQLQNESSTATTIYLASGTTAGQRFYRVLGQNQGDGGGYPISAEFRMATNTPLYIELSGANQVGYTIWYYIENAG